MTDHHHFNSELSHHALLNNLRLAFWLNLVFAIFEFIGGWWTNSVSILAGALHDLGDSATLGISWILERISQKRNDPRYSYGYRRFSMLGAVISAIVLIVGSIFVVLEAIPRLIHPQLSNAKGMIALALLGMVINGVAVLRMRGAKNMNARLIMWHLLDDVLGWGTILLISVVLIFADIRILDPILSLAITFFVLWNVIKNFRLTLSLFLQAVPEQMDIKDIENTIRQADCVRDVHHTHIWSLDGENHVLTTHVVLEEGAHREDIRKIKCLIHDFIPKYQLAHTTIEFEYRDEDCSMNQHPHQGGPNE
jgi:cobalt-zinc-cadmium efflux system protein